MIGKAIESALLQDYPELEVVISDNCSTDNSDEVIRKYTSDPRVKYFRNETNLGMLGNFRKATFEYAQGELITYVSSDDYLTDSSFLNDAVRFFEVSQNQSLVFGRMSVINLDSGRKWIFPQKPFFDIDNWNGLDVFMGGMQGPLFSCCGCLMRMENLKKVDAYHKDYIGFDLENNYKMMLLGSVGFINKVSYVMTGHSDNNTFPKKASKIIEGYEAYENVERYASSRFPDKKGEFVNWKNACLLSLVSWGFHVLSYRGGVEYTTFKKETKRLYPAVYYEFKHSIKYKRMLFVNMVKKVFPAIVVSQVQKWRG